MSSRENILTTAAEHGWSAQDSAGYGEWFLLRRGTRTGRVTFDVAGAVIGVLAADSADPRWGLLLRGSDVGKSDYALRVLRETA